MMRLGGVWVPLSSSYDLRLMGLGLDMWCMQLYLLLDLGRNKGSMC